MHIHIDDLQGPEIYALLQEHLRSMALHSPPESVHALDIAALRQPGITFWTAWDGAALMGCGAIKQLSPAHAELKSMRTADRYLRRGVAQALLSHIMQAAQARGMAQISLETGSAQAFAPARTMYAKNGFAPCGPFAGYTEDPYSVFMTKML
jgi:putative acetyltransferase